MKEKENSQETGKLKEKTVRLSEELCGMVLDYFERMPGLEDTEIALKDAVSILLVSKLKEDFDVLSPNARKIAAKCSGELSKDETLACVKRLERKVGALMDGLSSSNLGISYLVADRLAFRSEYPQNPEDINYLERPVEICESELRKQGRKHRRVLMMEEGRRFNS